MKKLNIDNIITTLNIVDLIGISSVVAIAFVFQFVFKEYPCPLCLLQRLGLLAIGFGFLLNIHYTVRPLHYALSLLASVATAFVALRQIILHIEPGNHGYGSTIFGLHMYTWVFILCLVLVVYLTILLSFSAQYHLVKNPEKTSILKNKYIKLLAHFAFFLYLLIIASNIFSTFVECGLKQCPDNPVSYRLLQ